MRKLEINTNGSTKLIGMMAPGVILASVKHTEADISFKVMLNINEKPAPGVEKLITRMDGQEDTYNKLLDYYYKKYDIGEESDYKEKRSVLGIMTKDISYDLKEISDLI